jgi:tetratricopeptide (TPR) repeat protein
MGHRPRSSTRSGTALTHEVAYGSLLAERRRMLHARIVGAIEALHGDRLDEQAERLAHHALRGEVWDKAPAYLQQAGLKAYGRSANREAVAYFEQALTALTHLSETRETLEHAIDVRFDLRNALFVLADFGRIEGCVREAEILATRLDDQRRLGWVWTHMSSYHWTSGGHVTAVQTYAQKVEAIGETLRDVPLQVASQYYRAAASYISGDHEGAEACCRRMLSFVQGDRHRERFRLPLFPAVLSRALLARTLAERGVFEEGEAHGQEAIRIAEALDHPFSLIYAALGLAYLDGIRGKLSQGARLLERALAQCREWNITLLTPPAMASLSHMYAWSGRIREGVSWLQQALTAYESAGIGYYHSISVVQLGEAYLLADQTEDARACADRAVMLTRERGERGHEAWALRLLGEIVSQAGQPDMATAEAQYGAAMALATNLGMRPLVAHCHRGLGTLSRRTGDQTKAHEHLTTAKTMYREMGMDFWLEQMDSALGAQPKS